MLGWSVFTVVTEVMLLELAAVKILVVLIAVTQEVKVCNPFIYLTVGQR